MCRGISLDSRRRLKSRHTKRRELENVGNLYLHYIPLRLRQGRHGRTLRRWLKRRNLPPLNQIVLHDLTKLHHIELDYLPTLS